MVTRQERRAILDYGFQEPTMSRPRKLGVWISGIIIGWLAVYGLYCIVKSIILAL